MKDLGSIPSVVRQRSHSTTALTEPRCAECFCLMLRTSSHNISPSSPLLSNTWDRAFNECNSNRLIVFVFWHSVQVRVQVCTLYVNNYILDLYYYSRFISVIIIRNLLYNYSTLIRMKSSPINFIRRVPLQN